MKQLIFLVVLCLAISAKGATLADLVKDLRLITGEPDSMVSSYTDSTAWVWLNLGQDIIVKLGGYLPKTYDYTLLDTDTFGVVLPSDFRAPVSGKIWDGAQWEGVLQVPEFILDSDIYMYTIDWKNPDSARLYVRGSELFQDQLFRLSYIGDAASLDSATGAFEPFENLRAFVVQEAMVFYLFSLKDYQAAFALRQMIRQDMGLFQRADQ